MKKDSIEMSRYIDLDVYHKHEKQHPGYMDMITLILEKIVKFSIDRITPLHVLEIGGGTGLFTKELLKVPNLMITVVEPDCHCIEILKTQIEEVNNLKVFIEQESIATFSSSKKFDIIVSTFAHHHIPLSDSKKLVNNLCTLLSDNGIYLVGDELIPPYLNEKERVKSLLSYHHNIISIAENEGNFELASIEYNALVSGIRGIGDFKRTIYSFEDEMTHLDKFKIYSKEQILLSTQINSSGIFVYEFKKS